MINYPAIMLSNVSKVYSNGVVALQDMSLTIGESQFVSIVGPSGCGKSTVLHLIAGLSRKSSGSIQWGGDLFPKKMSTVAKRQNQESLYRLAFVFQEAALMPWANVVENVRLPLKLAGIPKKVADATIEEAIALVGLEGFERSYPRELSGGMKMRVSIARSLVTKPDILLMDEPFGALDEMTRSKLNSDLLNLWSHKHWTVVFVTHNIYEAVYLSERVVVMTARPGRVIADVTIDVPFPRTEEFRISSLHNKYCREITNYLSRGT
ncbi:nitrate/sulfonate/bicarbonate ABC transporter ATP-binding protein [Scytonema hofmannii PCC 7110]|uniref:Nitrate/sulfonate/bicarbonate ABC transporter ATP-binding protein n=1 Tax=Scytonema hofmannii PCC 7110 TaxID=128403 RepID=A0A139XHE4_9CYAN|nr:ABC transporter ATP-binding protein [Scytonema hofmannii]KYC44073.1 nitrate/sulfonate/bicarbonate ABC transporter ATP-binding protein [Scytonema hofmannii PCC 7110]